MMPDALALLAVRAFAAGTLVAASSMTTAATDVGVTEPEELVAEGRAIAERNCSRCHDTSGPGPSPVIDAPAFSTLAQRWPIEFLAEALAEGIVVGHPTVTMPQFAFSPDEIDALLAYLESIQGSADGEALLGDPAVGADLAGELCSGCHRALPDEQTALQSGAVAFWDLAADPHRGISFLREFMSRSHPFMPFDQLTPQDREDIIAYMRSLADPE